MESRKGLKFSNINFFNWFTSDSSFSTSYLILVSISFLIRFSSGLSNFKTSIMCFLTLSIVGVPCAFCAATVEIVFFVFSEYISIPSSFT